MTTARALVRWEDGNPESSEFWPGSKAVDRAQRIQAVVDLQEETDCR